MSESWIARLGYRLERFGWLHPILLRRDVVHADDFGRREEYTNRLNGHLIVKEYRDA